MKYKFVRRDCYGLALVDTGNLVKGSLVSKEFWESIKRKMSGRSNVCVGTAETGGKRLKVLEQEKNSNSI